MRTVNLKLIDNLQMSRIWSVIFKSILFQKNWTSKHLGKKCWRCWFSYPFLIFGPAYSVSDERSAMTRNYAISLPRHPPGPPSITQPSEHHRHSVMRFKDRANPHLPPHSSQVTSALSAQPRCHPENFTFLDLKWIDASFYNWWPATIFIMSRNLRFSAMHKIVQ